MTACGLHKAAVQAGESMDAAAVRVTELELAPASGGGGRRRQLVGGWAMNAFCVCRNSKAALITPPQEASQ